MSERREKTPAGIRERNLFAIGITSALFSIFFGAAWTLYFYTIITAGGPGALLSSSLEVSELAFRKGLLTWALPAAIAVFILCFVLWAWYTSGISVRRLNHESLKAFRNSLLWAMVGLVVLLAVIILCSHALGVKTPLVSWYSFMLLLLWYITGYSATIGLEILSWIAEGKRELGA